MTEEDFNQREFDRWRTTRYSIITRVVRWLRREKPVTSRDKRTAHDIALAAIDHKLTLSDVDLCAADHRTSVLPTRGLCAWPHYPDPDKADTVPCDREGLYGTKQKIDQPTRRGCAKHTAAAIRARLQLERARLQRETP